MASSANKVLRRKHRKIEREHRNRVRLLKPRKFKLFIDDSGNTGLNIFDQQQPIYYSLGIMTRKYFEISEECMAVRKVLHVDELHGSELGLQKINDVSDYLIQAINNHDFLFISAEINKLYFGGMKFFDVIFDSGTNPGVSALHCWSKPLKYLLMIRFIDLINEEELRCFWTTYAGNDIDLFKDLMRRMRARVADYKTDDRTKLLINDAFEGAERAPKDVMGYGQVKEDSPNVTGFVMFIQEINKILDGGKGVIDEVIYDNQDQFGSSFEYLYQIFHHIKIIWTLTEHEAEKTRVFNPHFSIQNSKSCDALQLVDTFLFVHKKTRNVHLHGKVKVLYDTILKRMHSLYMTKEALWIETELMFRDLYQRPISTADIIRGRQWFDELETKRVSRLRELPEKPD